MKSITYAFITSRFKPQKRWFWHSLVRQLRADEADAVKVLFIDAQMANDDFPLFTHPPKPSVWSGPTRLTTRDWWSAANARNTALCLCETEWICFVDDRSVLLPGFVRSVREAMAGNYIVCGTYEKRRGMTVEKGVIKHAGIVTGADSRGQYCEQHYRGMNPPFKAPGEWTYGCAIALPLEWALSVGGLDESCDGLSGEDYVFGLMLANHGYPIMFDPRMKLVEDRTPGETDPVSIRRDKGVSPSDKSHKLLELLRGRKTALHAFDLRAERAKILAGGEWSPPWGPTFDFFDNQPISEMTSP